jgi:hypothetical protein
MQTIGAAERARASKRGLNKLLALDFRKLSTDDVARKRSRLILIRHALSRESRGKLETQDGKDCKSSKTKMLDISAPIRASWPHSCY